MEAHITPLEDTGYYLVTIYDREEFDIEENRGTLLADRIQVHPHSGIYKIDMFQGNRFIGNVKVEKTEELEKQIREVQNA